MTREVITLDIVCPMNKVYTALASNHSAFPLLNKAGNIVGIIPRRFIKILIRNGKFTDISLMRNHDVTGVIKSTNNLFLSPQEERYRTGNYPIEEDPDEHVSRGATSANDNLDDISDHGLMNRRRRGSS